MLELETLFGDDYPILKQSTKRLMPSSHKIIGMEHIKHRIKVILKKEEMSNAILAAEPGAGKTAVVQDLAAHSTDYIFLETSIPLLNRNNNLIENLEKFINELIDYRKNHSQDAEIVVFMDEIHQLPYFSQAAVESIKPQLSRSAELGFHIIGATTYGEYMKYIRNNSALYERFELINVDQPSQDLVFHILKNRMKPRIFERSFEETTRVHSQRPILDDDATEKILREIIQYTDTYIKSSGQPRKSTNVLDTMLSEYYYGAPFDHTTLSRVLYDSTHIRIDLQLDGSKLRSYLDSRVFDQDLAIDAILGSTYAAMLNMTEDDKPNGAFLFVGPTGVGKAIADDELVPTPNGLVAHGNLVVGDQVYDRLGQPTTVVATFPQGLQDAYAVHTTASDKPVVCNDQHLWQWRPCGAHTSDQLGFRVNTLRDIIDQVGWNQPFEIPKGHALDQVPSPYNDYYTVTKIEDLHRKTHMQCIVVANEEHLYQLDHHIVTHNTELAKAFTSAMFGDDARPVSYDMAEFNTLESAAVFQQLLTDNQLKSTVPVILIDEIEKAHLAISHLFFSVLDEARLKDRYQQEANFSTNFFIFTTNEADKIFKGMSGRNMNKTERQQELARLRKLIDTELKSAPKFPAPLLGRMTDVIPFAPLNERMVEKITKRKVNKITKKFEQQHHVRIVFDPETLLQQLTLEDFDTDSDAGGARQVVRIVHGQYRNKIAEFMVMNPEVKNIHVSVEGVMRSSDKTANRSASTVVVKRFNGTLTESTYFEEIHEINFDQLAGSLNTGLSEDEIDELIVDQLRRIALTLRTQFGVRVSIPQTPIIHYLKHHALANGMTREEQINILVKNTLIDYLAMAQVDGDLDHYAWFALVPNAESDELAIHRDKEDARQQVQAYIKRYHLQEN